MQLASPCVQAMHHASLLAAIVLALARPAGAASPATGSLVGTLRVSGDATARAPLPVHKHYEVCGDSVPDDRLVVGPGGGLRYAVVTVEGVRGGRKPERDATLVLDNRACRFEPHVQVAEVGQWLEIRNSDPILHNADARLGEETLFNLPLPPGRQVRKPLGRPGLISFDCNVRHTWMRAYVAVADHPYHTVTDAYGDYEIGDLPPGTYTMRIWHEELGTKEQPVVIEPGRAVRADLTFPAPTPQEATR